MPDGLTKIPGNSSDARDLGVSRKTDGTTWMIRLGFPPRTGHISGMPDPLNLDDEHEVDEFDRQVIAAYLGQEPNLDTHEHAAGA